MDLKFNNLNLIHSYPFNFDDRRDYIAVGMLFSIIFLVGLVFGFELLFLAILMIGFILVVPPSALIFLIAVSIYYGNSISQEELWITVRGFNISISDFLYAILVLKIIAFAIMNSIDFLKYLREHKEITIWLGYFFILVLLGVSSYAKRAVGDSRFFLPLVIAFAIPLFFTVKKINRMFVVLIPIAILLSVVGILFGEPPPDTGLLRSEFRFLNSTMSLTCGIILLLGIVYAGNKEKFHKWWWLVLIYLLGVVLVTQHRSVWVGLAVGVTVYLFRRRVSTAIILKGAVALISVIVVLIFLSPSIQDSFMNSLLFVFKGVTADDTGNWRMLYWAEALNKIQSSPIFGLGFGDYYEALAETGVTVSPHNFYIHILFKTGIIGLILQILIFAKVFSILRYLSRTDYGENKFIANALFPIILMNLVYYLFYTMELLTGLLIGYILLLDIESKQNSGITMSDHR